MISNKTGYSSSKQVPLWELLWFSAVANLSITGMNFSLMLNTVGLYQVSVSAVSCTIVHGEGKITLWRFRIFLWWHLADLKIEHNTSCLSDGMGASQQNLFVQGDHFCVYRGLWCWCVHGDRCGYQWQGLPLCLCGCHMHVSAADCE